MRNGKAFLLLMALLCCTLPFTAALAQGTIAGTQESGAALVQDALLAPGEGLSFTYTLEQNDAPGALRLQMSGMALVESSVAYHSANTQTTQIDAAAPAPDIIFGSDGCILLFAHGVQAGDTIVFRTTVAAQDATEARLSLSQGDAEAPLFEAAYRIDWQPPAPSTPLATAAPTAVPAPIVTQPSGTPPWVALFAAILCFAALIAVLRMFVLPHCRARRRWIALWMGAKRAPANEALAQADVEQEEIQEEAPAQADAEQEEAPAHAEEAQEEAQEIAPAQAVAEQEEAPAQMDEEQEEAPAQAVAEQEEAPAQAEEAQEEAPAQAEEAQEEAPAQADAHKLEA